MKKTLVRVLTLTLVAAMLVTMLVSCGGVPAGEYVAGDTSITKTYTKYTFKGSNVTAEVYVLGKKQDASFEGKYKVKDGEITFTYEDKDGNEKTTDPVAYKENEDGSIEIGVIKFTKVED